MKSVVMLFLTVVCFSTVANSQCISGNCTNGEGTFKYRNGMVYSGQFRSGLFNGYGHLALASKDVFKGNFKNGQRNGAGLYTFAAGHVYNGNFTMDRRSGLGTMKYVTGDKYDGYWHNDQPHGEGLYTFKDGSQYHGEFQNGKFHGKGKFIETNKEEYTGVWNQNVLIQKNNTPIVTNNVTKPKVNTNTTDQVPPRVKINDKIKDCTNQYCTNEIGRFNYRDGSYYIGTFLDNKPQGKGEVFYVNGDYYKGGWEDHGPNGNGVMKKTDGTVHAGLWDHSKLVKRSYESESMARMESIPKAKTKVFNDKVDIYAVIIGVAAYNHMNPLKYTDDDAYHLYAFLKSPEGGAIPDGQIKILIDDAATKKNILSEVSTTFAKADANDVVLLYMSGHGLEGAFVPVDYDGRNNLVDYDDILNVLAASPAKHKLYIADACHSGSMYAAKTPMSRPIADFYTKIGESKGGMAVMTSSKTDEVSLEYSGVRHGVFSHYLIEGMKGDANKNNDGYVTIEELFNYVYTNVRHHTNNAQTPSINGDYDHAMPVAIVN
jgi:hypothetical protein